MYTKQRANLALYIISCWVPLAVWTCVYTHWTCVNIRGGYKYKRISSLRGSLTTGTVCLRPLYMQHASIHSRENWMNITKIWTFKSVASTSILFRLGVVMTNRRRWPEHWYMRNYYVKWFKIIAARIQNNSHIPIWAEFGLNISAGIIYFLYWLSQPAYHLA